MIGIDAYFERITSIHMQFDLARKAINGFSSSEKALQEYLGGEVESLKKMLEEAVVAKEGANLEDYLINTEENIASYGDAMRSDLGERLDEVLNQIDQNEILVKVALMEGFIKDCHREILRQKPTLLRADRTVPLGRLVSVGLEEILAEEIEREVQSQDRKNPKERAKYFQDVLDINWFDGKVLPLLKHVLDVRNAISHSNPALKVSKIDKGLTHLVAFALPMAIVMQAAKLYPGGFYADLKPVEKKERS